MVKPDEYVAFMRQAGKSDKCKRRRFSYLCGSRSTIICRLYALSALNAVNNYLQKFPNGAYAIDANFYKGEIYYRKKDWKNALSGYEFVAANAPNKYAEKAILSCCPYLFL